MFEVNFQASRRNTSRTAAKASLGLVVELPYPMRTNCTTTRGNTRTSAIPSFFVAANLQPQIRILISRYSSCESCGTGFCVTIIADEGVSFQKSRFRSLDLTLKGQKVPKSGHF